MARDRNNVVPRALGTHIPVEPEQSAEACGQDDSQRSSAAKASRKRVSNWNLGSIKRFPRPTAPPAMAAYKGRRWLPDNRTFDDYEGGPTIEMLRPPSNVHPTMIYHSARMELSAAWATWVDHGYRIKPSTFQMFYQCRPLDTMEHIMPIGTLDSYDSSMQVPDRVTGAYSLDRTGAQKGGSGVRISDVVILSASDMIKSAEQYDPPLQEQCRYGHDLFVRGCTSGSDGDERPIYVDLELDAIRFDEDDISISVDIDSIIWMTKTLRLRGTIGVYMTPPFHSKPGISKHNHAYLDLLIPQSEEDAHEPGGRAEWLSLRVKMDSIPHLCIGRISSAASTLNVYIFFPRLKHDDAISGKKVTIIPNEVEDIFWDRVLLPSIGDCADISWQAYMKQSLQEARYKNKGGSGTTGGKGTQKIIPLSNDDFLEVQVRMHDRIKDGHMELSMFGSCFFVLEGKGIKLITKDGQRGRFQGPEDALLHNLPDLDWNHMMDRTHGELLVDVGISFTPRSSDVPVVGLWRLDALEASFGAGGYNKGQLHHHNTLSRYGALQAEMQRERCQQTHVAFRSAYNLYYEAVRTTNNQVSFAMDSDAYKTSSNYMTECFNIARVLTGSKGKTYGVRDEYRTSGKAARLILESVMSKAEEYLRSDPVLWIPSEVWFGFLARRVREVQRTQIAIVRRHPQNLGILTSILNYMLRSTTSTPIVFDSHLRESLALLEYRNVLETAGMFFLQDFDLANDTCLYDVQQQDDITVLALMGANTKVQRARTAARLEISRADAESESEEFPLGRRPSWARLKSAIASSPAHIMKPWVWLSRLSRTQLSVGRLFVMCTRHLWLMLKDEIFQGIRPCPESLQEAMKCWTTTSITDTLAAVTFDACNIGLQDHTGVTPGRMGPRSKSFAHRLSIFFPSPELLKKGGSQWFSLWTGEGYIAEFHRLLKGMDDDEKTLLQDGLADIFSNLHCLPASTAAAVWRVKQSAIVFVTNPAFYKIECLGRAGESRRGPVVRRPVNVIKGKRIFTADLMDVMPFDALGALRKQSDRQKRRDLHKKLTKANKHKRVPPPPRSRTRSRPFPLSSPNPVCDDTMDVDD
ncbi:hypothetical protein F4604DRAFT_1596821 [Suillus subluteus]|nr:hypothetical protein F4604DRAFT_1596821 [Suillus subluteus]